MVCRRELLSPPKKIVAVEAPIDVSQLQHVVPPTRRCRTVASCAEAAIPVNLMRQAYEAHLLDTWEASAIFELSQALLWQCEIGLT